jgi:hypothetical protein
MLKAQSHLDDMRGENGDGSETISTFSSRGRNLWEVTIPDTMSMTEAPEAWVPSPRLGKHTHPVTTLLIALLTILQYMKSAVMPHSHHLPYKLLAGVTCHHQVA